MAFISMIIAPLVLLCIPGFVCLVLGVFLKAKRKGLLIAGCVLCAPLLVFVLFTIVGGLLLG